MGPTQAPTRNGPSPTFIQPATAPALTGPSRTAEPERRSRHLWLGLVPGMVALVIMLVFIFQNLRWPPPSWAG